MREATANGIRLAILDLPEGNPGDNGTGDPGVSAWKLQQLTLAVKEAVATGHYVGLHAYWRPGVEGALGRWHALGRIEWDVEQWRQLGVNIGGLQLLVTEWGVDGGIAPEAPGYWPKVGWRVLCAADPVAYYQQVAAGETRARQLPWLKGLFLFTWGYQGEWVSFDHDEGAVRSIIKAIAPVMTPPAEPVVEGFTQAEREEAKQQFERFPATMKAANHAGYVWQKEWQFGGFYFALVYLPEDFKYKVLKLEPDAWQVVGKIDL